MSLGLIIKAPEGLVLAAESRVTLTTQAPTGEQIHVNFDNATKLLTFNTNNYKSIGAVTYGAAAIGVRTAQSFIPEFETSLNPEENLSVEQFAQRLSTFFMQQWTDAGMPNTTAYVGQDMTFNVAGYNAGEPYGRLYSFDIPRAITPVEKNPGMDNFGITWGGQREIVDRLITGYDSRLLVIAQNLGLLNPAQIQVLQANLTQLQLPIPIQFMPLQDCVNLALLFIRTTISAQELTVGIRGCGGPIDLAIITRTKPLTFIQQKEIIGEYLN